MTTRPRHDPATSGQFDPIQREADAAEVTRALLTLDDIAAGSVLFLMCDSGGDPITPVVVGALPADGPTTGAIERLFGEICAHVPREDRPGVIFARARLGQSFVLDSDREWHDAVAQACRQHGMRLHWAFVVSQHAVIPFPAPLAASSAVG